MALSALVTTVPNAGGVAINGHVYPLLYFHRVTLPSQRQQVDQSDEPGKQSVSPYDLWWRDQDDYGLGSGQTWYDRNEKGDRAGDAPSRSRFYSSVNVDPWTIGEASILAAPTLVRSSASSGQLAIVAGTRLYHSKGGTGSTELAYTEDGSSFTNVTGLPASQIKTLATDGYTVYIGYGSAQFIYTTNTGTSAGTVWGATHKADLLAFVKNRLIAALGTAVSNLKSTTLSTVITPTFITTPTTLSWGAIGEGDSYIYLAGNVGDKTTYYGVTITPEGTDLGAPIVMGTLPDGENATAMDLYQGIVTLGTSKGVRFSFAGNGEIKPGPLVPTTSPVYCFEPQEGFIWYGLTNPGNGTWSGLGRVSLSDFVSTLKFASAWDLLAPSVSGKVASAVTFLGLRFFTVDASGLWKQSTTMSTTSQLLTSRVTLGVPDKKFYRYLEVVASNITDGNIAVHTFEDGGSAIAQTSITTNGLTRINLVNASGDTPQATDIQVRFTFTKNTGDTSPKLLRWNLRGLPIPRRGTLVELSVDLRESYVSRDDVIRPMNPKTEYDFLAALAGTPVTMQLGQDRFEMVIDTVEQISGEDNGKRTVKWTNDGNYVQGQVKIVGRAFS